MVHDDDITGRECRHEHLLHIGPECRAVHRAIEDHRSGHPRKSQSTCEGRGFPVAVRNAGPAAFPGW